jgi:hypothetical protein
MCGCPAFHRADLNSRRSSFFYLRREAKKSSELSDADLDDIVRTLTGVAVGVFDQESFLLWWNGRIPVPVDIPST